MLPLFVPAQGSEGDSLLLLQLNQGQEVLTVPKLKTASRDKIDFGFQAGASFTSFGRHGSMFDTYIAPEIRYQAAPRVQFSAGIALSTTFLPGVGNEGIGVHGNSPSGPSGLRYNRVWIYAAGDYQVSPRLTIGGMVVKELDNDMYRNMNAFQKNSGFQSVGMNVNYKITDNFHVGARFNVTDGRPYYYNDPTNPFMRRSHYGPGW
jgi:hypothetical protein